MTKRWISFLMAIVMVFLMAPVALADDPTPAPSPTPEAPKATLTAIGGTFPFDGKAHVVSYSLENGADYKNVYYSVDGGESWTKTAPRLTNVGKITVTIRAVKEGGKDPLTAETTLEVTSAAVSGMTVTITNCTSANVRQSADSNSNKLGEAKRGKTFPLLAVEGKWYKIQYTSSQVGYVYYEYVKTGKAGEATPKPTGNTVTVVNAKNGVNIRAKASSSSKILGVAENGEVFKKLGTSGKWVKVEYEGKTAYIFGQYLKNTKDGESVDPTPKPTPAAGKKAYIVNCKNYVNVREKASSSSTILGTLKLGAEVSVVSVGDRWTKIAYKDGDAYVYSKYLSAAKPVDPASGKIATVVKAKNGVNIRAKASSSSKILGVAYNGDTFKVLGTSGNWVKVEFDGISAFIHQKYAKLSKEGGGSSTPKPSSTAKPTPKPTAIAGAKGYIVKCKNYVNVREKADSSSKILGNLRRGEEVSVISVGDKWVKIAYKDGTGYVYGEYVSSAKPDYAVVGKTATIVNAEDGVNIRAKASSSSKILGVAYNGDTFTVQGLSGRWVKVEYNGDSAYIYDSYIKIG